MTTNVNFANLFKRLQQNLIRLHANYRFKL